MSKLTKDQIWKSIIEDLFNPFLHYFFADFTSEIDFSKGFVFLDKELQTISLKSNSKNRRADKLAKVWLKNGEEKWILIHIEVQGYTDDTFSQRVYNMHSRIKDKYNRPVAVLIIYTDDSPTFHPKEYKETCFSTEISLKFATFKVLEHPPESQKNPDNPFSIIMEIVWHELRKNRLDDDHHLEIGKKIIWKLARKGFDRDTIQAIIQFIRCYVSFEKQDYYRKLDSEIDSAQKINKHMGITELLKKHEEEKILEKGIEKGIEKGRDEGLELSVKIIQLHKKGMSAKEIAKQLEIKLFKVKLVLKNLS